MTDAKWVAGLSGHRVGRLLSRHLHAMEVLRTTQSYDCAVQEVQSNEKVFVHALDRCIKRRKPYPCGLSSKLPRFIAIVNLSGERLLVHSDSPALIRCLCAHSSVLHQSKLDLELKAFVDFPKERTEYDARFVLLTYSMPWQSGIESAFWHISACTIDGLDLKDRLWHFSSASAHQCEGKSVRDALGASVPIPFAPGRLTLVGDEEIGAFCDAYTAVSLDNAPTMEGAKAASGTNAHLEVARNLERERKKDQLEIKELKGQLKQVNEAQDSAAQKALDQMRAAKAEHAVAMARVEKNSQELLDVAREHHAALCLEMKGVEANNTQGVKEHRKIKKMYDALAAKCAEAERQSAAKDALHNAALSQHVATISRLEGLIAASEEKATAARVELERSHASTLESVDQAHASALQKVTLALQSKERICNQLSENNERRDVEVESHKTHQTEQDRRIVNLEARVRCLNQKLSTRAKVVTRTIGSSSNKNASTSTHHCASTQTDPAPEPVPVPVPEPEPVPEPKPAPAPALSFQDAIDLLQELVTTTGNAQPRQLRQPLAPQLNGYMPRPLPFPNFVPNMGYYDPNGHHVRPQFMPHAHRGSY
jgi:hypothetical protein